MQSIYKMNWLIILAAITLAVYAKAQSCDSTYKERDGAVGLQYNSTAASCSDECSTFVRSASNSTIEYLLDIMNNEAFEIDHNVSLMTESINDSVIHMFVLNFYRRLNIHQLQWINSIISSKTLHPYVKNTLM